MNLVLFTALALPGQRFVTLPVAAYLEEGAPNPSTTCVRCHRAQVQVVVFWLLSVPRQKRRLSGATRTHVWACITNVFLPVTLSGAGTLEQRRSARLKDKQRGFLPKDNVHLTARKVTLVWLSLCPEYIRMDLQRVSSTYYFLANNKGISKNDLPKNKV